MKIAQWLVPVVLSTAVINHTEAQEPPPLAEENAAEQINPRELAASLLEVEEPPIPLNLDSQRDLAHLLSLENSDAIITQLQSLGPDDFDCLQSSLRSFARDPVKQAASFDRLHINLGENNLDAIASLIIKNQEVRAILTRVYDDLEPDQRETLHQLARYFTETDNGRYLWAAMHAIDLREEKALRGGDSIRNIALGIILIFVLTGYLGWRHQRRESEIRSGPSDHLANSIEKKERYQID